MGKVVRLFEATIIHRQPSGQIPYWAWTRMESSSTIVNRLGDQILTTSSFQGIHGPHLASPHHSLAGHRAGSGEPAAGEGYTVAPVDGSGMDGADAVCHPVLLPDSSRPPPRGMELAPWTCPLDLNLYGLEHRGHSAGQCAPPCQFDEGRHGGHHRSRDGSPGAGPFSGRGVGILMGADQNSSTGNGCGARSFAQGWPGWGSSKAVAGEPAGSWTGNGADPATGAPAFPLFGQVLFRPGRARA